MTACGIPDAFRLTHAPYENLRALNNAPSSTNRFGLAEDRSVAIRGCMIEQIGVELADIFRPASQSHR